MVLESLAAIGLAGNIVQFIAFASHLVSKSREIYRSASGVSDEHLDLKTISDDVLFLSAKLKASSASDAGLGALAGRCIIIADELCLAISELRVQPQGRKKWDSFKKALRSLWKKPRVQELMSRLDNIREQILLHLVADFTGQQAHVHKLLDKWQKENVTSMYDLTQDVQCLALELGAVESKLSDLHGEAYWDETRRQFSNVYSRIDEVSRRHTIIRSLLYHSMKVRHSTIHEAHHRTFDWIFHPEQLPNEDPRSNITYSSWLRGGSGIYWITGKPGSGKSTLMKYLEDHRNTKQYLQEWSGGARLVKASHYFWISGTPIQKSLSGLLQSLLFDILNACPELVPILCPDRWKSTSGTTTWSNAELRQAFTVLKGLDYTSSRFYFHVDGLDEYHGDHWDVISILQDLAAAPNVKLCLSSRPWNCFQDAFGQPGAHLLRLHELTRQDIELYAREGLLRHMQSDTYSSPKLLNKLVADIGLRAEGVFLWVFLVVRSLRDGIVNCDPISLLQERLQALPTDLEDFFDHILRSVDAIYQERMACTFLAAVKAVQPLCMIHYSFLEEESPTYGLEIPFVKLNNEDVRKRTLETQRRLNGRYKGLLEPTAATNILPLTEVVFLHRTLRDFLGTARMQKMLHARVSPTFNVHSTICRSHLAVAKYTVASPVPRHFANVVAQARAGAQQTGDTSHEFEILDHVEEVCQLNWPAHLRYVPDHFMLFIAVRIGRLDYVAYRLQLPCTTVDLNALLGDSVLCQTRAESDFSETLTSYPPSVQPRDDCPDPELVKLLLAKGARPNRTVSGIYMWEHFLVNLVHRMDGPHKDRWWEVFKSFMVHGADVPSQTHQWAIMLTRSNASSRQDIQNTLRYFKLLFEHGLNPNTQLGNDSLWIRYLKSWFDRFMKGVPEDLEADLLRLFLRHGADTTQNLDSWFDPVFRRLSGGSGFAVNHITVVEVLLEHGFDPNVVCDHGGTIWEKLLSAPRSGASPASDSRSSIYWSYIYRVVLTCLKYGADPTSELLYQLVDFMETVKGIDQYVDLRALRSVIQDELSYFKSRERASRSTAQPETSVSINRRSSTRLTTQPDLKKTQQRYQNQDGHRQQITKRKATHNDGPRVSAMGKRSRR